MVLLPPAFNCGDRVICHSAHTHTHTTHPDSSLTARNMGVQTHQLLAAAAGTQAQGLPWPPLQKWNPNPRPKLRWPEQEQWKPTLNRAPADLGYGHGSKLSHQEVDRRNFCLWFHLPGQAILGIPIFDPQPHGHGSKAHANPPVVTGPSQMGSLKWVVNSPFLKNGTPKRF